MLQLRYCMYQTSSGCFLKPRPSARMLLPPDTRFSCSNQHRSSDTLTLTYKVHKCALNASDEKGASTQIETLLRDRLSARCSKDAYEQLDQTVAFLQAVPEVQLVEFAIGLNRLLNIFSANEILKLLQLEPQLLRAQLGSWLDFLEVYGFNTSQIKNLISQSPAVIACSDVATAGAAIVHLQHLGFTNDAIRHRVVAYCPQVLMMAPQEINLLIKLWAKFRVGEEELPHQDFPEG